MQIRQRPVEGAIVVDLSGDGIGSEPSLLGVLIASLLESGHRHIVLNLEHLQKMDSTCLAEIVAGYKATMAARGVMKLASPNMHIRRLLQVTKMDTFLEIYDLEADAVASFSAAESRTS